MSNRIEVTAAHVDHVFELCQQYANEHSHDIHNKVGVAIDIGLDPSKAHTIYGANRMANGVGLTPERQERPAKYAWLQHAEIDAIAQAAQQGISLRGSRAYIPWFPCATCASALVSAGVKVLHCTEPDYDHEIYNFREAKAILDEGGVRVLFAS